MPVRGRTIGWWSPDPRGILPPEALRVSRSTRRSIRRFETRINTAFEEVITACSQTPRPHGWINGDIIEAYLELHELGWAHSVETWTDDDQLVGGLYGVCFGGLFAGESMFHTRTDASKVALVRLVDELRATPNALLDVQWATEHLQSLGATAVSRTHYLELLAEATAGAEPPAFSATTS